MLTPFFSGVGICHFQRIFFSVFIDKMCLLLLSYTKDNTDACLTRIYSADGEAKSAKRKYIAADNGREGTVYCA